MTSIRFFIKENNLHSSTVFLTGNEHHHLSRVVRIKPKENIWLFDEKGRNYLARVEEIGKDRTQLFILEKRDREEPKVKVTLAQAILKANKMDIIFQKSTELGVTTVIPVNTVRTVVKVDKKIQSKMERWKKIALEAAKQSKRSCLPLILTPMSLEKLVKERDESKKLLFSESKGTYLRDILTRSFSPELQKNEPPSSVLILIGPEGGWTDEEEKYILNNGFEAVSLGRQTLRAETAALCSVAMISHFWNL